jgi:outer membrane protein TolC
MPPASIAALIQSSLARRADLRAIRKLVDAAAIRRRAAASLAKPGLEFSAGAGFSSLQTRSNAYRNGDVSATLSYEFLRGNNLREGKLDQSAAELRRESARVVEAERQVRVSVTAYWAALESAAERCGQTLTAVLRFEEALAGEREKYRLGVGSIVDLLTVEDRLTIASAVAVEAEANFAAALARLALVSGSILNGQGVVTAEPFLRAGSLGTGQ